MDVVEILDNDNLLRRIHPEHIHEESNGTKRPASSAFTNTGGTKEMSVNVEKKLEHSKDALHGHTKYKALVRFTASFARTLGQDVIHSPQKEDISHADVVGKITKQIQRKFAKQCIWV